MKRRSLLGLLASALAAPKAVFAAKVEEPVAPVSDFPLQSYTKTVYSTFFSDFGKAVVIDEEGRLGYLGDGDTAGPSA